MDFVSSTNLAFLAILIIFASICFILLRRKLKEDLVEMVIDRISSFIRSNMSMVLDLYKPGPWYLVIYTKDSNYPIWISNNNIRSIHPDPKNYKLIIKQFNGEDMVIDNVANYELRSTSDLRDYDM